TMTKTRPATKARARKRARQKPVIGWREWVTLPDLGGPAIKAKIDTGARTSALHAFRIRPFEKNGVPHVAFFVHPVQHRKRPEIACEAPILEQRAVKSSNGQSEMRYVIETRAVLGDKTFSIELTLTNRDELGFRMLIGREALRGRFLVDSGKSYRAGKTPS
ncbi:MAG: RimK/LysX family protein, partial [Pseudomonadota bacterium]